MAQRLEKKYEIEISCSDYGSVYGKYRISKKHYMTKSETCLVESFNSLIRHYLARFQRRTKRYSKAVDMIHNSILILFNKNLVRSIFG
jgi:insertion element IS1 protein InsB